MVLGYRWRTSLLYLDFVNSRRALSRAACSYLSGEILLQGVGGALLAAYNRES